MTTKSPKHTDLPDVEHITLDDKDTKNDSSKPSSPEPSHIMTGDYVALMETNGKECESWYYFIRHEGNEEALQHLQDQLEKIEWYILDDLSTFDLDLEHFVSAKTAKEMVKLELNSYAFHRKFDGVLKKINFNFRKKDLKSDERMMGKVFDLLGYGQIEDYISDEDLDPEDLTDHESSDSSDSEDSEDTEDESDSDSSEDEKSHSSERTTGRRGVPPVLVKSDIPRWALAKKRKFRK
jgi:hypothetical protein